MQFPYPIARILRITNANGTTAIQIGPGPTATWYGQNGSQLVITADQSQTYPTLQFWNANHNNFSYINGFGGNSDSDLGINSGGFPSIRYPSITNAQITAEWRTDTRSFEANVQTAPGQVIYGGDMLVTETQALDRLFDQNGNVLGTNGVFDTNSSGAPNAVAAAQVANAGVFGGMFVDSVSVQFKGSINENAPVMWDRPSKWLVVSGWDWQALTLLNLWTGVATYLTPAVKVMPDGQAVLSGTIGGGTTTDNTAIFNLPFANIAPTASALLRPAVSVGNANARILINGSGQAFCYGFAAGTQVGLDGLSYRCKRP